MRAFQDYLVAQGISWPALNQTVCALRFFYGVTLDRPEIPERIAYARTPRKLPVQGGDKTSHWNAGVVLSVAAYKQASG